MGDDPLNVEIRNQIVVHRNKVIKMYKKNRNLKFDVRRLMFGSGQKIQEPFYWNSHFLLAAQRHIPSNSKILKFTKNNSNFRIPSGHQRGGGYPSCSNLSSQIQWVQARIANAATNVAQTRSHRFNQTTLKFGTFDNFSLVESCLV